MKALPESMYVHHVCAWCLKKSEIRSPETGVRVGCETLRSVLGTKPRSSARAVSVLNHWASLQLLDRMFYILSVLCHGLDAIPLYC